MTWAGIFEKARSDGAETAGGREVDEELMFHLRSLVDDNLAAGMPPDEAWRDARERFGSFRRYAEECRRPALAGRLIGPALAAAGVLVVGLCMAWVAVEVRTLRREQVAAVEARLAEAKFAEAKVRESRETAALLSQALTEVVGDTRREASAARTDLTGRVVGAGGEPIEGADVLVILKTWPGGRFRQDDFVATSAADGGFRLSGLIPVEGQIGLLVAAVKDGHALTSRYQIRNEGGSIATEGLTLRLDDAPRITFVVRDAEGRPVPGARMRPSSRRSAGEEDHFVYFQGSEGLAVATDSEGKVGLGCFERGDDAEIYLELPGGKWGSRKVRIPDEGDVVTIPAGERSEAGSRQAI